MLCALCAVAVVLASARIPDPEGFAVRMPAGALLLILGAMAVAGHLVPRRAGGLVAGAAALGGGALLLGRVGATGGLLVGGLVVAAQLAPRLAARRRRSTLARP